ncbi:MAG: LPS export ABC transporter periplasmic protein LptC [Gammaproteobacteria bacterium]|nr:LPS export ABC transporter periplasmic protein LptC [Gammaproteobacteria bacterium]
MTVAGRPTRWWAAWVAAGALLGAAGLWLWDPLATPPVVQALPDELAGEPDLYMEDALITQYQPNGSMKYQLQSTRIRHFERDNLTRLAAPVLTLHNPNQPPWKIDSHQGYIRRRANENGTPEEVVFLRRDVGVEQRYEDGRRLRIESPSLYIYPDRQFAETQQAVMIDTEVGRTTAVGLRGDLQRGLLKLFSSTQQRVHTIVLPGQFK